MSWAQLPEFLVSSYWWFDIHIASLTLIVGLSLFSYYYYYHFCKSFTFVFRFFSSFSSYLQNCWLYSKCFLILMWNIWECHQFKDSMNFFMTHEMTHCCTHIILLCCTSLQHFFLFYSCFTVAIRPWLLSLL